MPRPAAATCYFRVIEPIHFPVRADAGDALAVWALPMNLWVLDPTGQWVLRRIAFPEARLWSALDDLLCAGLIRYLDAAEPLRRPLPTADAPSRPSLRVIRAG